MPITQLRRLLTASLCVLPTLAHAQAVWEGESEAVRQKVGLNGWQATIPFEIDGDPLVIVDGRVNGGRPSWWVLDTGASLCLVDRTFASRNRLRTGGSRTITGAGKGTVRVDTVTTPIRLTVQGVTTGCTVYAAVDLRGLTAAIGRPIAGVLGYEFFARQVVSIDFTAHTMRLFDSAVYRHVSPGDTLPLDLTTRQPRVTIRVRDGRRPVVERVLIVDTGSSDAIDDSSLVNASTTPPRYVVSSSGLGESYRLVVGTLDTTWIGRWVVTRIPSAGSDVGIIGTAIWSRFTCVFDYRHGRLYLEPNETFGVAFDRGSRSGILFLTARGTEPVVSEVDSGSPGEVAGIRVGDVLYEIDGRPTRTMGADRITKLLNRRGNVYQIDFRRGTRRLHAALTL